MRLGMASFPPLRAQAVRRRPGFVQDWVPHSALPEEPTLTLQRKDQWPALLPCAAAAQALRFALCALAVLASASATAQSAAALYADADIAVGEKLLREHRCEACHSRKFGGDGTAIYRPKGRINTPGALRGMVETCNLELNLTLFPDEVTSIAAVLNRDHYRFK